MNNTGTKYVRTMNIIHATYINTGEMFGQGKSFKYSGTAVNTDSCVEKIKERMQQEIGNSMLTEKELFSSKLISRNVRLQLYNTLTFWRRNYFFLIWAHSVYKMWIIQEPNTLELWNKLHFEEKKRRVYTMFKIFSTYICWINV